MTQKMVPVHPVSKCRDPARWANPTTKFIKFYKITNFSPILLYAKPSISMTVMLFAFSSKMNGNILIAVQDANSLGCKPDFLNSINRVAKF